MKKLTLILDQTNWLEATWSEVIKTESNIIHCESYSGHKEHIDMLRAKAKEFNTSLDEYKDIIKQCEDKFIYPTDEEIAKEELQAKIQEALTYLSSTDHKDLPRYKPKDDENLEEIFKLRDEAREYVRANS